MKKTFFKKIARAIGFLSPRERGFFIVFSALFFFGILGGLVSLSNRWTTIVPARGGTYHEGVIGVPRFINPVLANSDIDRELSTLVYNGLVRIDQDGNPFPDLAESWEISPDGLTYTVTLKPKLYFHDGKKLTADDVVYTIQKIQDSSLKSPLKIAWNGITVSSDSPQTVTFVLEKPYAGFLQQMTVGIIPKHIWENISNDLWSTDIHNTDPIGSGPYRVKSISRSRAGMPEKYTLHAFRKFALGRPFITTLVVEAFQSKLDAYTAFDKGSIEGLSTIDSRSIETVESSRSGTQVITEPLPRVFGLFLNISKNELLMDAAVAKAINLGIDKSAIISTVFGGYATPLAGPLPTMIDEGTEDYETRKALAEKTLDTAGWTVNSETGMREKKASGKTAAVPLAFSIATADTPELESSAKLIADQLAKIGIAVEVKVFEVGSLNERVIRPRDFDALLFGEIVRHDTDLYAFWHSSQKSDPGLNIIGYASARVDGWLESALKEPNLEKRQEYYALISEEIAKSMRTVFLYAPEMAYLTDNHVQGIVMPPITTVADRFGLVYQWYINHDRVWNIFLK